MTDDKIELKKIHMILLYSKYKSGVCVCSLICLLFFDVKHDPFIYCWELLALYVRARDYVYTIHSPRLCPTFSAFAH